MSETITTCYRHPDRRAGVRCQRCGNPICPTCMVQASVGFHCPDCAKGSHQRVYNTRNLRRLNQPVMTYGLIAVNVLVFIAEQYVTIGGRSLVGFGELIAGARYRTGALGGVAGGEWWRIITSGFLHENYLHIGVNMFVLYVIGSRVERAVGRARYLALYMVALLSGSLFVLAFNPFVETLGASGAILGLAGVALVYQRMKGLYLFQPFVYALLLFSVLLDANTPGVSVVGHVGGIIGGALAAYGVITVERRFRAPSAGLVLCAVASVALILASIVVAHQAVFG